MIIRKIAEYSENHKVEKILLICDDKDEGWEMTSNELMALRGLIDKVYPSDEKHTDKLKNIDRTLEIKSLDSIMKNVAETFNLPAEILSNFADQFETQIEIFKSLNKKTIIVEEEECPDYIEPPEEITSTDYGTPNGDLTSSVTYKKTSDGIEVIGFKVESDEERKCRICGCTQNNACEGGCYWTEIDLCSNCRDQINLNNILQPEKKIFREENYDFPRIKRERRDYTKYIKMYRDGAEQKEIEESLSEDFGIAKSTATQNYYSKVKAEALKQIENEKVIIIDESKPAPGKLFTDAERERIQKAARIK